MVKFKAGVILSDEEVRQLTESGCEVYPMQWVEVDKNPHRGNNDYSTAPPKYESRLVGCGNFEITEGLRTDSRAADVDSHNIVCSWCAQAHVSFRSCDFIVATFKG